MALTQVQPGMLGTPQPYNFKNRIINGAMVIDQRNAGASAVITTSSFPYQYTLDRWSCQTSQASKLTVQQNKGSVTPPVGFANYLGATVTTTATVGATDFFMICQGVEGYSIADLGWGTANAKTVTLSFQVYCSTTGTFGGAINNASQNRCYPFSYSIPVANTWTSISITIPGDTSGTWNTTNGAGMYVFFGMGVGSTFSGTAGSWSGSTYLSATGAVSLMGTSNANFYITGVQLEVGVSATGFDYRPYGTELALCQRYFCSSFDIGTAPADNVAVGVAGIVGAYATTAGWLFPAFFPVPMRAVPTITIYKVNAVGSTNGIWSYYNFLGSGWVSFSAMAVNAVNTKSFELSATGSFTAGYSYPATGNFTATAEL